jgi:hypothetical protein
MTSKRVRNFSSDSRKAISSSLRSVTSELVERGLIGQGDTVSAADVDGVGHAFEHCTQFRSYAFRFLERVVLFWG